MDTGKALYFVLPKRQLLDYLIMEVCLFLGLLFGPLNHGQHTGRLPCCLLLVLLLHRLWTLRLKMQMHVSVLLTCRILEIRWFCSKPTLLLCHSSMAVVDVSFVPDLWDAALRRSGMARSCCSLSATIADAISQDLKDLDWIYTHDIADCFIAIICEFCFDYYSSHVAMRDCRFVIGSSSSAKYCSNAYLLTAKSLRDQCCSDCLTPFMNVLWDVYLLKRACSIRLLSIMITWIQVHSDRWTFWLNLCSGRPQQRYSMLGKRQEWILRLDSTTSGFLSTYLPWGGLDRPLNTLRAAPAGYLCINSRATL